MASRIRNPPVYATLTENVKARSECQVSGSACLQLICAAAIWRLAARRATARLSCTALGCTRPAAACISRADPASAATSAPESSAAAVGKTVQVVSLVQVAQLLARRHAEGKQQQAARLMEEFLRHRRQEGFELA